MNRNVIITIILILALVLTACGGSASESGSGSGSSAPAASGQSSSQENSDAPLAREDEPTPSEETGSAAGEAPFDFSSIEDGLPPTDIILSAQSAESKQDLILDGKEHGYEVEFGADGSTTLTYDDGTIMVQNPDGTWVVKDDDGEEYSYGGSWPENEFTKLLPKPEFGLLGTDNSDGEFTVAFSDASLDDIRAYAEKVKAAGFNKDVEVQDQNVMGMDIYAFNASNADGYSVSVYYAAETGGLTISK